MLVNPANIIVQAAYLVIAAVAGTAIMIAGHFWFRPELNSGRARLSVNRSRAIGLAIIFGTLVSLEFVRAVQNSWMLNFWIFLIDFLVICLCQGVAVIILWRRFGPPLSTVPSPAPDQEEAIAEVRATALRIMSATKGDSQ